MSSIETRRRSEKRNRLNEIEKPRGYNRGLEIDSVVGASDYNGQVMYLVKWKDCDELDLLSSKEIVNKNPEILIEFYEKRSIFRENIQKRNIPSIDILGGSMTSIPIAKAEIYDNE